MRIRRRLTFSFSAALALSLLLIGSGTAASASSKRIAFVDSGGALWTALPNGSGVTNLGGTGRANPSISTDGATIYFDAGGAIQSISSGGGSATTVCASPGQSDPAISPSGALLAYESSGSIAVGPSTGCGSVVAGGSDPAWSPDSRQLVFIAGGDVFVAAANGSGAANLTTSSATESDPAWSPSGSLIAYISEGELLVMNVDGSNKRLLTSNANDESNPTWSADGAEILFARDESGVSRLYAIQLSDGAVRLLGAGSQPDWGLAVANTVAPTITLQAGATTYADGVQLSADVGSWVSINPRSFSFRWQRCGSGGCVDIAGATSGTYTLAADDVGNTVRVVVVASTADGSAPGTSEATPVVAASAPRNLIPPTIEGEFVIGETLTAENGTWVGTNLVFTYQWQRCEPNGGACTAIPGATAKVFAPTTAEVGKTLKVVVTGTNSLGTGTGISNASPAVASNVPANTLLPTIAEVVSTTGAVTSYRADEGEWTGVEPMTTKFQWRRCDSSGGNCTDIAGASLTTYTPTGADIGSRLRVAVTQTNVFGSATAVSNATAVLAGTPPTNTSRPFVTGTERVGSVLSASVGTWTGSLPLTYTYQWQRCNASGAACSNIAAATSASYIPTTADQGATLVVSVTARNTTGSATIASLATDPIEAASTTTTTSTRPTNTRVPTITGVLARGRVLTAGNGTWTGTTPMTFAYQWQRCPQTGTTCTAIVGATRSTYTLAAADVGRRIRLLVTAANVAGPTAAQSSITRVVAATAPTAIRRMNGNARANRLTGTARAERIDGKGGNDRIDGKGGKDIVIGGTGNDTILAADGIAETINCGPGRDRVTADRSDKLTGCERVTRRPARRR